jgi:hypothetical protein
MYICRRMIGMRGELLSLIIWKYGVISVAVGIFVILFG